LVRRSVSYTRINSNSSISNSSVQDPALNSSQTIACGSPVVPTVCYSGYGQGRNQGNLWTLAPGGSTVWGHMTWYQPGGEILFFNQTRWGIYAASWFSSKRTGYRDAGLFPQNSQE
jgi:hypothetical protein